MKRKIIAIGLALATFSSTFTMLSNTIPVKAEDVNNIGTKYYFSSKSGDNQNLGTSADSPWETLDKIKDLELKPGDQILLEKGSVFDGYIHLQDVSGTAESPIKITSYGDAGGKPIVNGNSQGLWYQDYKGRIDNSNHKSAGYVSSTILLYDVDYVEVSDLEITNQSNDFDYYQSNISKAGGRIDRTGVSGIAKDGGTMEHIYLDNLYIHNVDGNLQDKHMNNGGIQMNAITPDNVEQTGVARYNDVKITNCYIKDVSRAGLVLGYTYENSRFNSSAISDEVAKTYGHTNILIEGNYVQNAGNDAICVMYSYKPLVQKNISDKAGSDLDDHYPGYWQSFCAAIWPWKCKDALFQYNEAFDTVGEGNGDGQAWDIDWSDGTVYQYNYSHGNGGGAMLTCLEQAYNGTFRYNISQNDLKAFFTLQGNPQVRMYNNVFYVDGDRQTAVHHPEAGKRGGQAYIANNIFYNKTENPVIISTVESNQQTWTPGGSGQIFTNNIYYGYDKEGLPALPEENAITADPMFVNPGNAPIQVKEDHTVYDQSVFEGYKLQENSPAINAGIFVQDNPIATNKDFFGNAIGMVPDIGVHETNTAEEVTFDVYSNVYNVDSNSKTINNITKDTTVEAFKNNIQYASVLTAEIKRGDNVLQDNDTLLTGDKLVLTAKTKEEQSVTYTLNVKKEFFEYSREGWTATAGSVQSQEPAQNALDGNPSTLWHTDWNGCKQEDVWITIDMQSKQNIAMLRYVPRSKQLNGIITKYRISVSDNNKDWTEVATGTWESNNKEKIAEFSKEVEARYVKLEGLETATQENKIFGSAAEIYLGYEVK